MKVTILIDNNSHPELNLYSEHGLSIYFEVDGYKWLFDVGASEQFYTNASDMGINVEDIDFLVLSHGHFDHTGGLEHFIRLNGKARIIMSAHIKGEKFFSYRLQTKRNISIDYSVVEDNIDRFILAESNIRISKNVGLVCEIPLIYETPRANKNLYQLVGATEKLDDFKHEAALAINTSDGIIVFSGCSHSGVLNILEACSKYYNNSHIIACLGGTHLVDGDSVNVYESDTEINDIGKSIISLYPKMRLITGHCTGINAQRQLLMIMGENFSTFHSGAVLEL